MDDKDKETQPLTPEQFILKQSNNRDLYREIIYTIAFIIFFPWLLCLIWVGLNYNWNYVEGMAVGSINGVYIAMLKDGWQFFFRTSGTITGDDLKNRIKFNQTHQNARTAPKFRRQYDLSICTTTTGGVKTGCYPVVVW
jgi:hypothetical protein